jgi:thioredoxin reductase (NADPH)
VANELTLLHRRDEFRGAPQFREKMRALVAEKKMELRIGQVTTLHGDGADLSGRTIRTKDGEDAARLQPRCCPSSGSP